MEQWEKDLAAALDKSATTDGIKSNDNEKDELEEANRELTSENEKLTDQLGKVADILAAHGIIHNTPKAKSDWTAGL